MRAWVRQGLSSPVGRSLMSLFLLVSCFLSLSFSTECSDTTVGKTTSIACVLLCGLGCTRSGIAKTVLKKSYLHLPCLMGQPS